MSKENKGSARNKESGASGGPFKELMDTDIVAISKQELLDILKNLEGIKRKLQGKL